MRGAWIGALGGAVVAGAAGAAVGTRRLRGRGPATTAATGPSDAASSAPAPPGLPPWSGIAGRAVTADDGVRLHVELDGPPDAAVTLVFVHGYGLNRRSFRFQRRDLADAARLVFYDHRSHGASGRSPVEKCTIDQLGADLRVVLDAVAGDGPVVLVGHSMGGMTVLALAEQAPELFGDRIVGVALLSTSAGQLSELTLGLPKAAGLLLRRVRPRHLVGLSRGMPLLLALSRPRAVLGLQNLGRTGQGLTGAVVSSVVHRFSFGGDVDPALVDDVETMIGATGMDVLAAFAPTFLDHDKLAALPTLAKVPVAVVVGDADLMTPVEHSRTLAETLPAAELTVLDDVGHMVPSERPDEVQRILRRLLERSTGG